MVRIEFRRPPASGLYKPLPLSRKSAEPAFKSVRSERIAANLKSGRAALRPSRLFGVFRGTAARGRALKSQHFQTNSCFQSKSRQVKGPRCIALLNQIGTFPDWQTTQGSALNQRFLRNLKSQQAAPSMIVWRRCNSSSPSRPASIAWSRLQWTLYPVSASPSSL
jgi:hypothetical protein